LAPAVQHTVDFVSNSLAGVAPANPVHQEPIAPGVFVADRRDHMPNAEVP